MAQKPRTLFEAATARGRVLKQGEIVSIVMDGAGAVIVFMQEFVGAQKWASSRVPTANLLSDRARFLDQFTVLISRPGSVQATRGNERNLEKLARAMLGAGYDLAEWTLPMELKTIGHAKPPPPPAREDEKAAEGEEGEAGESEPEGDHRPASQG